MMQLMRLLKREVEVRVLCLGNRSLPGRLRRSQIEV